MRLNHVTAALAVVSCLSFASWAEAGGAPTPTGAPTGACCNKGAAGFCGVKTAVDCCGISSCSAYLGDNTTCDKCFEAPFCKDCTGGFGACCGGTGFAFDTFDCLVVGPAPEEQFRDTEGETVCETAQGQYQGGGTLCGDGNTCPPPPSVPTISEWGIASLGLLLLAGLTIKFRGAFPRRA